MVTCSVCSSRCRPVPCEPAADLSQSCSVQIWPWPCDLLVWIHRCSWLPEGAWHCCFRQFTQNCWKDQFQTLGREPWLGIPQSPTLGPLWFLAKGSVYGWVWFRCVCVFVCVCVRACVNACMHLCVCMHVHVVQVHANLMSEKALCTQIQCLAQTWAMCCLHAFPFGADILLADGSAK